MTPDRALNSLPYILQGRYDGEGLTRLIVGCVLLSSVTAITGMMYFAQRDI
jgi:hypothetical protein